MPAACGGWPPVADRPLWPLPGQREGDVGRLACGLGGTNRPCGGWAACAGDPKPAPAKAGDTSEINFRTTADRRRGLGEIGKGVGRGLLLHAMLALDAHSDACLGLVAGQIWTRQGRVAVPHEKRRPGEKESWRWISTAERAKQVLSAATMVTVVDDREGDIYAKWACVAEQSFHLLTRSMHDRALAGGASLYETAASLPIADVSPIELMARANRPARQAKLALRFGRVTLQRPRGPAMRDLPKTVELSVIKVTECDPPADAEPLHWHLLTTHDIDDAASA